MLSNPILFPTVSRAKTYERKKNRSERMLACELRSPLRQFFTGGLEYDDQVDLQRVEEFIADFHLFRTTFGIHGHRAQLHEFSNEEDKPSAQARKHLADHFLCACE